MVSIDVEGGLIKAKFRNIPMLEKDSDGSIAYTGVMKRKTACIYLWPASQQVRVNELAVLGCKCKCKSKNDLEELKDVVEWLVIMKRLEL